MPKFYTNDDLPPVVHGSSNTVLVDFARQLRQRPGEWAEYPVEVKSPSSTVARLRNDRMGSLPCTHFEARLAWGKVMVRFYPEVLRADDKAQIRNLLTGQQSPSPRWAHELFAAVGPSRHDAVFRALSKVLHPDVPTTGDEVLFRQLQEERP